ncbi:hypothetical protein G9A89_014457 [Geosiphon pyriformis]|nr:hypothetical protein G9A89_014457 [Geosiphon pyriformis]
MKKTIKVSGSESGFKPVVSKKKRKGDVLAEGIDNREVATEAPGACNTTESESIDMKEECLVKETSVDYGENGTFVEGDPNQMPKSLRVKTKKVLEKPLGVINYGTVNTDNDVLDNFFLLLPLLPIKLFVQVPVHKSFALDIDFMAITGKSSQEKLSFIKKNFSSVNDFEGASTLSKFGGIICATFTSEKAMMAAGKLANDHSVVVNTDFKCPNNIRTNRDIVLKKIPVGTSMEAVHTAVSEFGIIKKIRMQLVGLWQKVIIKIEDQNQADLLANKWSIFIGKDAVHVARADVNKQIWDSRDRFRALFYTLPVGTNAHDLWDFLDLVGEKTCVIDCNSVNYTRACYTFVGFGSEDVLLQTMTNMPIIKGVHLYWLHLFTALCSSCNSLGHMSLVCKSDGVSLGPKSKKAPLLAQDQFRLAKIYEKKSVPIFRLLAFGSKTWTSVVGSPPLGTSCGYDSQLGSIGIGKSLPPVVNNLEKHELAKRLDLFVLAVFQPSPRCQLLMDDIVMGEGSGKATYGKTAMLVNLSLKTILEGLSASVLSLSACFDGLVLAGSMNNPAKQDDIVRWHKDIDNLILIFMETKLKDKARLWLANKFDNVCVFSSGLNSGYVGAGVTIVLNSSLAKHVCKVSEIPVSILGLYAGASSAIQFSQADKVNSLIAKAVNKSSFVVLGSDFNEDGSHRYASFKKCFELGLVNSLHENCSVAGVEDFFDTDHRAVFVSVGLGGLLDVQLNSIRKQVNKDHWKYNIKNVNESKWSEFREAMAVNACMFSDAFVVAKWYSDLDVMWDIVRKVLVLSAGGTFRKKWFKCFDSVFNKMSSRFHKLELLVSKLVKASHLVFDRLDSVGASSVKSLFFAGSGFDAVHSKLAKTRKSYHSAKLLESKHAEDSRIRQAIEKRIESFEIDKDYTIQSVLERLFRKVVLDHLVVDEDLVLEPELVKSKVNVIIESWTWKRVVSLDYVFDGAFTNIMCSISFDEMFGVISDLLKRKAAGLSGIPNEF